MTISTEVRKAGPFIGNDSASVFPFAFKVFKAADLIVVRRQDNIGEETTLVLDSDYHVTLNGNQDTTPGGVVTLVAGALASGFTLVVSSELPYLQPTDLTNQGGFYPKVITNALDRLTIFCQQLLEITGRTLKLPITAPTNISAEIPLPNPSELIAWNETGTGLTTISPQSLVTSIAYGSATADLFAGDGVTTTFPLTTNPASVNNLDVSIGGHSQRPVQGGIGDYSWNGGASITFVTPPPAPTVPGDKNVLVRYMQAIPVSDSEALHAQTREALRRGYAEAGFNLVAGSFETGGTLAAATDVLLQESTGAVYAWTGALPKTVAPGFDPVGVVGFELRTDAVLRDELAASGGAGKIGIDMLAAYQLGTIGAQMVPLPAVDNTGITDSTAVFNAKLLSMANAGGGVLKPIPGTYKINGAILLPSYTVLDLTGVTLLGNGTNTLIENAAVIDGVLTSIISEHGVGFDGNGTHATFGSVVLNGTLGDAAKGIRFHRFNFGGRIDGTFFAPSLGISWDICHSWGMKIQNCTVYAKAKNYTFVDWMEISGNSFEGLSSVNPASTGLEFGGGSYSTVIHSNGFHHFSIGISLIGEMTNLQIYSNHFEDCRYHVVGDAQTKTNLSIHHNWMKANLAAPENNVIPIVLNNTKFGKIGPNFYSTDGASSFAAHVICSTADCIGNEIVIDHSIGSQVDLTNYQVAITNKIVATGGSNDASVSQPWVETLAGTSGYTIEKYRSRYHAVPNAIPLCTVNYSGTTITIDTFVSTDAYGGAQLVAYNFKVNGSTTRILAGHICHGVVKEVVNADYYSGGSPLVMTITNNNGYMRITITGAPSGGNITGWVKEI